MIYLLSGRSGAGKDTFAKYLQKELEKRGKKVCNIEFTRTLKGYCKDYFGWDGREETKPRDFLQQVGTELIREKLNMPFFHIHRLIEDICVLSYFFDDFIVDDVRFPLEIQKVRETYPDTVAVVLVKKNDLPNHLTEEQQAHVSEHALDHYTDYDLKIENKTLEELAKEAEKLVRRYCYYEENDQ